MTSSESLDIIHHDREGMTIAATVHGSRKMLFCISKELVAEKENAGQLSIGFFLFPLLFKPVVLTTLRRVFFSLSLEHFSSSWKYWQGHIQSWAS